MGIEISIWSDISNLNLAELGMTARTVSRQSTGAGSRTHASVFRRQKRAPVNIGILKRYRGYLDGWIGIQQGFAPGTTIGAASPADTL
jgi:hypothetical protein